MEIAVVIGLVVLGVIFLVSKTASLNSDPRQQELAQKMMLAVKLAREHSHLQNAWWANVVPYFEEAYRDLSYEQRETRAAHALSMIRQFLTEEEYESLKAFHCRVLAVKR